MIILSSLGFQNMFVSTGFWGPLLIPLGQASRSYQISRLTSLNGQKNLSLKSSPSLVLRAAML